MAPGTNDQKLFGQIVAWAQTHLSEDKNDFVPLNIPKPLVAANKDDPKETIYSANKISPEDTKFVEDLSLQELKDLIAMTNALSMQELLTLTCVRMAAWFKGRTPKDIAADFGLTDDQLLSPEEIESQIKKHEWARNLHTRSAEDGGKEAEASKGEAGGAAAAAGAGAGAE